MKNQKIKIIFIGTPDFGGKILEGLIEKDYRPVLVITEPDKPTGRKQEPTPPPVKIAAQKNKISIVQPEKIRNLESKIKDLKPDLIIVAAYGQILPKEILEIPKYGCLNIHPSLLPKYRGASPIQAAILNGDEETGISLILMNEKIDEGDIIACARYRPLSKMNYKELEEELAEVATDLLIKTIPALTEGKIKLKPQDNSKATYTKILKRQDGKINWQKPAEEIERQIRAFYPWPGSFTCFDSKLLKILEAKLSKGTKSQIGEVFLTENNEVAVGTGQNCLILQKLQLEGKNPMSADDFLRGHPDFIKTILK